MKPECRERFFELHRLLKKRRFRAIERRLIDEGTGRVKSTFRCDLNHAWYLCGQSFFLQSRWKDAIHAYRKAYARDRTDWPALMAIGNCYDKLRQPKQAMRYLRRAVQISPRAAELQYNLGNALFDLGQLEDAVDCYRKAQRGSGPVKRLAKRNEKRARTRIESGKTGEF